MTDPAATPDHAETEIEKGPFNDTVVVPLMGDDGSLVSWVAGTKRETERLAAEVWSSTSAPGSAVQCFKEYAVERVRQARERVEADGVKVDGNVFSTDASAQIKYLGILVYAASNPSYSGTWKSANNGFVTLDSMGVQNLCAAIKEYLQACFAWEQSVVDAISAADTVEQLQAIDMNSGKPVGQGLDEYV